MFTDVRGFSKVASQLHGKCPQLTPLLEGLYAAIVDVVHKHRGIVDKFTGDGSMSLFGIADTDISETNCDHARAAVCSALEIQSQWKQLESEFRDRAKHFYSGFLHCMELGIGIHCDEVLVGTIRTDWRDSYTAIGQGVNLAKQLELHAAKSFKDHHYGNVLITEPVAKRLKQEFELVKEKAIKGISGNTDSITIYSVASKRTTPASPRK
jgi:adenylate cyclase